MDSPQSIASLPPPSSTLTLFFPRPRPLSCDLDLEQQYKKQDAPNPPFTCLTCASCASDRNSLDEACADEGVKKENKERKGGRREERRSRFFHSPSWFPLSHFRGKTIKKLSKTLQNLTKSAHALWLDAERGELFCRSCDDYVYDASFDACALGAAAAAWHLRGGARARPSSALAPPPLREAEVERREQEEEKAKMAAALDEEEDDDDDDQIDPELLRAIPRRPTTPSTAAALGAATDADAALAAALSTSNSTTSTTTTAILEPAAAVPEDGMPPGLRGLANLGNTCYISSVLQALVHAPPLRDFFLSGGHCRHACADERSAAAAAAAEAVKAAAAASSAGPAPPPPLPGVAVPPLNFGRGNTPPLPPSTTSSTVSASAAALGVLPPCLPCELSSVVSGAYSGERSPAKPAALLAAWWSVSGLTGAQQQDAHEFYLGALQTLDSCKMPVPASKASTKGPPSSSSSLSLQPPPPRTPRLGRGAPISRAAFGGLLRSDVTCCGCGFTSTAHDPFLDISVDVSRPRPPARVAGGGVSSSARRAAAAAAEKAAEKAAATAAANATAANAAEQHSDKVANRSSGSPTVSPSPTPALADNNNGVNSVHIK